jgi:hypothetical protein
MRFIPRAIDERYGRVGGPCGEISYQVSVRAKLLLVSSLELGPSGGLVREPLPELGGGRDVLHPFVDRRGRFAEPARPESVDENSLAIAPGWRLVHPLYP